MKNRAYAGQNPNHAVGSLEVSDNLDYQKALIGSP